MTLIHYMLSDQKEKQALEYHLDSNGASSVKQLPDPLEW